MSDLQERLDGLSPAKRALLEKLLLQKANAAEGTVIPKQPAGSAPILSHAEQRLWFVDRLERDHPFYNMPLAARLCGPLEKTALDAAVAQIVDRHESLRTTYRLVDGQPHRVVHEKVFVEPNWVDLSECASPESEVKSRMRVAGRAPFDVETGPLLRVLVYKIAPDQHIILLVMHHIISDGWSMIVMLRELTKVYDAVVNGQPSPLEPLPIQYADFAHWQASQMTEDRVEKQMEYWRKNLQGAPEVLDLPTDRPRPPVQDFVGKSQPLQLSLELTALINELARSRQTTPFVVLLAAQALLLGRFARQNDLVLGTASAGRVHPEIESQIGFFVNTLALRVQLEPELSFDDLVKQVAETVVQAHEHADVPFERLVEEFAPGRDRSYSPIFQSAMVMQNLPRDMTGAGGATLTPMLVDNGTAKYDLTFFLWEEDGQLVGHVEYRTALFDDEAILRLIDCYKTLLEAIVNQPAANVFALPILSTKQHDLVVKEFNRTESPQEFELLHQPFEHRVGMHPDKIAVVHNQRQVTYGQLNELANRVASNLLTSGLQREDAVLVALPRSIDLFATLLGVLKAGGSYVPVDPDYPANRIEAIKTQCDAKLTVDCSNVQQLQTGIPRQELPSVSPTDRAYVIFTSGSTGTAKGVEIEHRSIANFTTAQIGRMGVTEEDRTSMSFSPAFDGATSEIFYSISSGATSVIIDKSIMDDPSLLADFINQQQITVAKFPPALLSLLNENEFPYLRCLASAGDKLTGELAKRWLVDGRSFFNGYGPTEVAVGCTMMRITDGNSVRPPIGRPMNNMRVYVLDEQKRPVPIGAKGEIYVGGVGVARGYLNRDDLTAEAFFTDPFCDRPGSRMYRTGDLGQWLPDGNLQFVGRVDDQVSLRGFRIEPGEIAAALEELDDVRQAVVIQRQSDESSQLVAYVLADDHSNPTLEHGFESEHVTEWKDLFEQTHRVAPPVLDPTFNITGWVSTYTGQPIPAQQMREWTLCAVNRILALNPQNVLEIGCGTGLLLLRLVDHVQSYTGSDLLDPSLDNIRAALKHKPEAAEKVSLFRAPADQFEHLKGKKFDTIVLNSVAQYFPSVNYFLQVLEGALNHLAPGGKIFLGDLRNHRLQRALATSIELHNAEDELPIEKLVERIDSRVSNEEELLLDPRLFSELKNDLPRISSADVLLKDAVSLNELSTFRYDVVIRVDEQPRSNANEVVVFDESYSPESLSSFLPNREVHGLEIQGVTNPRVSSDVQALRSLDDPTQFQTVGDLRQNISTLPGIDPACYFDLSRNLPYEAQVQWNDDDIAQYNAVLLANPTPLPLSDASATQDFQVSSIDKDYAAFGNHPIADRTSRDFVKRLRDGLRDSLPSYMLPTSIVVMDEFPTTINGKIDKKALPAPVGRPAWAGNYLAARNETEIAIVEIWEELLDLRPIGVMDDFFELGGHSMMAVKMISEIEKVFGRQLPLAALFQDATIAHLARLIDQPETALISSTLVPLRQSKAQTAPLFCIHPAGGTVFCYMELVKHLGSERSVYGLQARGIDGSQQPHETLAEMAAYYARSIGEVYPEGPLHIAGWSLGGNIAFEVARTLLNQGREVGIVALLDSGLLSPDTELKEEDFLPLLMALFPGAMNVSLDELRNKKREDQLEFFAERAAQAGIVPDEQIDQAGHIFGVFQANVKAVHQYVADSFDGELHLFRPSDQSKTNNLFDDPVLGWKAVARHVHLLDVPGDHAHMLQSPAVEVMAQKLDQLMVSYGSVALTTAENECFDSAGT